MHAPLARMNGRFRAPPNQPLIILWGNDVREQIGLQCSNA